MRKAISALAVGIVFVVAPTAPAQDADATAGQEQPDRPKAIEYSAGYETRAKIHKYASFATLPLFATELALGQSIYDDPNAQSSAARSAHIAVGTGITGLFAVNTVTGVWNMWEIKIGHLRFQPVVPAREHGAQVAAERSALQCPKHDSKYQPTGVFMSGRATRNMDRLAMRKDGDALLVDLSHIIKSDVDPSAWAAAVIPA